MPALVIGAERLCPVTQCHLGCPLRILAPSSINRLRAVSGGPLRAGAEPRGICSHARTSAQRSTLHTREHWWADPQNHEHTHSKGRKEAVVPGAAHMGSCLGQEGLAGLTASQVPVEAEGPAGA